jgi:hypothetical protein
MLPPSRVQVASIPSTTILLTLLQNIDSLCNVMLGAHGELLGSHNDASFCILANAFCVLVNDLEGTRK